MAGWLKRVDGSGLESFKTRQKSRKTETWLDLEPVSKASVKAREQEQDRRDKLKSSFDEFLFVFLQETLGTSCFRPLPPMLGDGQPVDLLKLYLNVRERGGYERVSENSLWDSVATKCGFDSSVGLALKLVYIKYLHALNRCLQRAVENKDSKSGVNDSSPDLFGGRLMDLESDLEGFLSEISDKKKNDGGYTNMGMHKTEIEFICNGKLSNTAEHLGFVKLNAETEYVDENRAERINSRGIECAIEMRNDNDEYKAVASDVGERRSVEGGDIVSDSIVVEEDVCSRKRRREFLTGMLKWINRVAKDPCDPAIGYLPDWSKWKSYPSDQVWKQVLLVREAMLLKRNIDSSDQPATGQKKQKMHPFMYDDRTSSERQRFSQRILSAKDPSKKSWGRLFSMSSSSGSQSDEDHVDGQSDSTADSLPDFLANHHRQKRIPLGPHCQADVPEWTGGTYEGDTKWLGIRMWPLERAEQNKNLIERERIGKGRQDSCGCQFPGSHECVRFHVSEKRVRMRLELGPAFYRWKFDNMGEEVAYSWTKQEEKKFHNTVKSNPFNLGKYFWDELVKSFPYKSKQSLVNYYFNVFLLQQRGQQNRATPNELNSDEEDSGFGAEAANPGSIFCSPKKTHPGFR